MQEMQVQFLGQGNPLEKKMATQSSILAQRFPWTEDPGERHSMGSQRIGYNCSDLACTNPAFSKHNLPHTSEDIQTEAKHALHMSFIQVIGLLGI